MNYLWKFNTYFVATWW